MMGRVGNGWAEIYRPRNIVDGAKDLCGSLVYLKMQPNRSAGATMPKMTGRSTTFLAMVTLASTAAAKTELPWNGAYVGVNAGSASSSTCNSWALNGAMIAPAAAAEF